MMKTWKYGFHLDKLHDIKLPEDDNIVKSLLYHNGMFSLALLTTVRVSLTATNLMVIFLHLNF